MIRVLIADDQELLRHSIRYVLDEQPDIKVVGTAKNGKEALELAKKLRPDVLLMDVRMPEIDGVKCTELVKASCPKTKVLILTTFDDDEYVFGALCSGASGYLLKGISMQDLIDALHETAAGGSIISPHVNAMVVQMFARMARRSLCVQVTDRMAGDLSGSEMEIIREVGRGLSNKEIAATLHLSEGTVRNYISSALSKLRLRDRTQLAIWAVQSGAVEGLP